MNYSDFIVIFLLSGNKKSEKHGDEGSQGSNRSDGIRSEPSLDMESG